MRLSVLMATYGGERAEYLAYSLRSLEGQTRHPDQVVLVADGPIGVDQEEVIRTSAQRLPIEMVRLDAPTGLAAALNAGLPKCVGDWIVRMDSDDWSVPHRLERQEKFALEHPDVDLIASWYREFSAVPNDSTWVKKTPEGHDAIVKALRWRNVVSHPTIMVRRGAIGAVGGYRSVRLLEDYDLFMRLARDGARFAAVQEVLVHFRVSQAQAARRGGVRYVIPEIKFRYAWYRRGALSLAVFVGSTLSYVGFRLLPARLRRASYRLVRSCDS